MRSDDMAPKRKLSTGIERNWHFDAVRLCFAPTFTKEEMNTGEINENMQMWWDNKRIANKDWLENKMYRLWLVNFNKDKL